MRSRSWLPVAARLAALTSFCCWPIWVAHRYVTQDGTPHLYNSYLLAKLLHGNSAITQFAQLNPEIVPNLADHWILAALLQVVTPDLATRVFATLLFALLAAGVLWLRYAVTGKCSGPTPYLLAGVVAFNWPWFLGFYNFTLGSAAFAFSLGCWWHWRERTSVTKFILLTLLCLITFLSHLAAFAALAGATVFMIVRQRRELPTRTIIAGLAAVLVPVPVAASFLTNRVAGSSSVSWGAIPTGFASLALRLFSADPFALITRRSLPLIDSQSWAFALLTPILLLGVCLILLVSETLYTKEKLSRVQVNWLLLSAVFGLGWLLGPEATASGTLLRERCLMLAVMCLVPALRVPKVGPTKPIAAALLMLVLLVQVSALYEYTTRYEPLIADYAAAADEIGSNDRIGSIVFTPREQKFRSHPETNLSPYMAIGKDGAVWDNYELGYDVFPVVASGEDREFISRWHANANIFTDGPDETPEKLAVVETLLAREHQRFDFLVVLNERPELFAVRSRWFESEPYFVSGQLKLYRHR